ncbi:hypothetical protein BJ875DRAFT_500239 [Amylocarpus encephaloides]|uniref:Transmembrane protein n=1 Tax=Amylocarpus encephaloides TaxID=45428 RepID=A0A9P7Y914_9HELO|nr:hypothetical protein BJ875DRAFT_500239 [Amylocarpus encephaloides]
MSNSTECTIESNSDVTGIGIRASIYALCLLASIFKALIRHLTTLSNASDFSRSIDAALQLQGLALLCTAIYQTFWTQLTLFHAICVLHLLSLLGFGLAAKGKYGRTGRNRRAFLYTFKLLVAGAFLAFASFIWATAPRFGSQPECNRSTVYVVFGVSIGATERVFRYVLLALMCSTVVGFMIALIMFGALAACVCGTKRKEKMVRTEDLAMMAGIAARVEFKHPRARWAMVQGEVATVLLKTGVNVYAIVTLEQTISRNRLGDEERKWGFGQVLALFLLLGPVAELLNILLAKTDRDAEEEKEKEEEMDSEAGGSVVARPAIQVNQQQLLTNGMEMIPLPPPRR